MSYHISYITSHHIIYDMIWYDVISYIRSDQIRSYIKYHTSRHATSRRDTSRHVTSRQVWSGLVSSGLVSYRFISYHIILYYIILYSIITLVRHKKARFDSKMHGSTQKSPVRQKKCPVRHKNALPSMHQLTLPLSNIPPPVRNIFFQFYSNFKNQ